MFLGVFVVFDYVVWLWGGGVGGVGGGTIPYFWGVGGRGGVWYTPGESSSAGFPALYING